VIESGQKQRNDKGRVMIRRRKITKQREQEIAELAEVICEIRCPSPELAIDPLKIADECDITVSHGPYGDAFDGLLECKDGHFHIYVNLDRLRKSYSPRAKFTVGHELGHYFIDEHRNALMLGRAPTHPSLCEYVSEIFVEQEADLFASNLLMPWPRFLRAAERLPLRMEGIIKLADRFKTSITATSIRYTQAGIIPSVLIRWIRKGDSWESWCRISDELFENGYRKAIESVDDLVPDSATAHAIRGEESSFEGFFGSTSTAATWFPQITQTSNRNIILTEQAKTLGEFGVITLLTPQEEPRKTKYSRMKHVGEVLNEIQAVSLQHGADFG
jgi:hypothetical protein